MKKKIAIMMMSALVMTVGLATKAQAKDFGMSLAPSNSWRYLTNAEDCRDTKDGNKPYGYINLNRIQDATSYYIKAKAVNSDGEDRSEPATVKQYDHAHILEHHMIKGHYYYLDLKNLNYTSNYVWTSGQFGWY
ncbi:hypothetical protein N2W20_002082 [Clostridium perfringens]|uniref:hypothetical protein n=3 Tax=Clostridium perfringens TaxID=1502 RepID=UPI000E11D659|nr:hypothetical protein [Clostridium perfringens]EJT5917581.1 hypothetical protein [Clostridium perfringens]EJT5939959.1 hypothetical protein [Clostridium perfringens]EJT6136272.1 hypothetical protein [Clostridium perfringens]EJT6472012.1 hypothetical protein [Clostridium perfringens]MDH5086563.1 hypothetical protein [Clostridium perfringens]